MAQISKHINYSNCKIHSYDQNNKMIVSLGSNKCENNNNSIFLISHLYNVLLMSIVATHEKDESNVDRKSDMRKVCTSSVKSSSTLFYCSLSEMYNRVNHYLKKSHAECILQYARLRM